MRTISAVYRDPIELIWVGAARRLGIGVRRSEAVYASWDGVDTLMISTPAGFDPDDNVGQMIFHELCHALVEGPERCRLEDYGLDNTSDQHRVNEDAAMRLQAALAGPHGLRGVLAVTTEWRSYYDALPADPLAEGEDPAIPLARQGYVRATTGPWAETLQAALRATAAVRAAALPFAESGDLWAQAG
jgi:hypothetical protein